jgi:hypothetical protein
VVDVLEAAGHERDAIERRHRLAERGPRRRRLALRRLAQRQLEPPAADELAVRQARAAGPRDRAIGDREPRHRRAEPLARHLEQHLARRRGREREVVAVEVDRRRLAARRRPLVGRDGGVAFDQGHPLDRHVELLGDELDLRGEDALAEVALAGVRGDPAVGADGEPRVERAGVDVRRPRVERARRGGDRARQQRVRAEAHDERAARPEEVSPGRHRAARFWPSA